MKVFFSIFILLFLSSTIYSATPLAESPTSTIEYASPKAAYEALSKKQDVTFRKEENGWVVAYDKSASTIWSFPPATDPSFPAVIKRTILETAEGISIKMDVKCGASKEACDQLVRNFSDLNEKIKQDIKQKSESKNNL
ncbi:MAG: hypothetical protein V4708_18350 [Bacteroidota bacterium]